MISFFNMICGPINTSFIQQVNLVQNCGDY